MIKNKMNTKLKKGIFSAVAVVVLIAAVIAVNIFVTSKNYTVDVTANKIYSLSKQTKKTTLAQQGRYLLICLLSMLLLFLAGSVLILNRTQRQVYEQLEEISKLYTDELDNRFFRISRNLF